MNCEMKKAWIVKEFNEPKEKWFLFNSEGKAIKYGRSETSALYELEEEDGKVFLTYDEAKAYHNSILPTFSTEQVRRYIDWLWDEDKREELKALLPTYIFDEVFNPYDKDQDEGYVPRWRVMELIKDTMRGMICINAYSFHVSQISHIRYGDGCIEIELTGGKKIKTRTELEQAIVEAVTCINRSGMIFTSLKKDKKE